MARDTATMAQAVFHNADVAALLALSTELARRLGIETLDGLALLDWFARQRSMELQKALESLEDISPAQAALIQEQIDRIDNDPEAN